MWTLSIHPEGRDLSLYRGAVTEVRLLERGLP